MLDALAAGKTKLGAGTTNAARGRNKKGLPFGLAMLARLVLGLVLRVRLSTLGLAVARVLVDADLFAELRGLRAAVLFFDDTDLFLDVRVARRLLLLRLLVLLLVLMDGGSEGFVRLFVPFPSVCLRLR